MASSYPPLQILFFAFPSPGHYIPLIDIAALTASRGADSTVVVNPIILSRLPPSLLTVPGLHFHSIPFPSLLPGGTSTADAVPATLSPLFGAALSLLRSPFIDLIRLLRPNAVISDALLPFTAAAAASFSIPWYSFPGTGLFALSVDRTICTCRTGFGSNPISVPGLPNQIELTQSQLKETTLPGEATQEFFNLAKEADQFCSGVVVNSFLDLEPGYADHYEKKTGQKVFMVGPVSLTSGRHGAIIDGLVAQWLDKRPLRSVIYVCFGSLYRLPKNQTVEIGKGLEGSGVEFVWVIREPMIDVDNMKGRGLVISGWVACQAALLQHPSIGGFLTHCGWGGVTEAVAAGVPMLTWPMFGEQFYNEKLVVEVEGIGAEIGVKEGFVWGEEEQSGVLVTKERVTERVRWFMGDSSEMNGIRKRVEEIRKKAMEAVSEGGSSYLDVDSLFNSMKKNITACIK